MDSSLEGFGKSFASIFENFCIGFGYLAFCLIVSKFTNENLIHQNLDIMLFIFIQNDAVAKLEFLSIYFDALITFAEKIVEHLVVFTFSTHDYRCINA